MTNMKIKNLTYLLILAFLFSCKPELDEVTLSSGSVDFSKYVAIGNSLTAGFSDGELFYTGQQKSYPAILAQQMKPAGGGDFKQPMMMDEYGFGRRLVLDATLQLPVLAGLELNPLNFASIAGQGPFNNLGVPGAKSFHLVHGAEMFSLANPYYKRFAAQPGTSTILAEAKAQNPTFFTCWTGSNDVLGYALAGGAADSITSNEVFQMALGVLLQEMTANGAKGAIANITDLEPLPYFSFMNTQLPYNGLPITLPEQAAALNAGYAQLNAIIKSLGSNDTLAFALGQNPFVIADKDLPWGIRQMKSGELFLLTLPTDSIMNHGYGSMVPIPDKYVLTTSELANINNAIAGYNQTIAAYAAQFDLAYVDMNALLNEVATGGKTIDGINFTSTFVTGNTFSLDGVHLTGKASAMAANEFIKAINLKYGTDLMEVSPLFYPGITYR
ncbi:MAG: hypothetical protein EOM06_05630 [Sphingobacteriia bacterium]|nr:hypothetical protein [Sphingobacteriia bacterium]